MLLGYHTNSLADHPLDAALRIVADVGYRAIAITLDHHTLNPTSPHLAEQIATTRQLLAEHQLVAVIETGARYLLDPWHKHQPTLISSTEAERLRRVNMLRRAIDIARLLDARCVSFWSGAPVDDTPRGEHLRRLVESLRPIIEYAASQKVTLAFEPEPGHLIDTMDSFDELRSLLPAAYSDQLKLTIDVGHLHCQDELPIAEKLTAWGHLLANVHIEDMRRGVHEHLPFGEGEMAFPPIIAALKSLDYRGPVTVELPRHGHIGPVMARRAFDFLSPMMNDE